jgi:hypothetical protein
MIFNERRFPVLVRTAALCNKMADGPLHRGASHKWNHTFNFLLHFMESSIDLAQDSALEVFDVVLRVPSRLQPPDEPLHAI